MLRRPPRSTPTDTLFPYTTLFRSKQIPLPNIEGALRDQPNYVGSGTIRFNEDLANTRWDYYLSGKTHVFGRYSLADYRMDRSEEHTSELQSLMRISYAVFGLKKKILKRKQQ